MPEQLLGPDGKPVDLGAAEDAFNAAMAAPADGEKPDYPAPPHKDEEAPFGRKADGSPRQRRAGPGRPRDDKARTARNVPAVPEKTKQGPGGPPGDYTETLNGFGQAVWMALAAVPIVHTQAFAVLWQAQLDAEVAAWNTAAQQDANVRRGVEKLQGGPVWVVGIAIATAPLVGGAIALAKDEKLRGKMAAQTRSEFEKLIGAMREEQDQQPAAA
jgi:hypothetical protein